MEPSLFFDKINVNFKSLLVGRTLKDTVNLVNNENIPFSFSFSETSFEVGNNNEPVVSFTPKSGTIGPNSSTPIEINFTPSAEKMFNFNLICNIKKKPNPVTINIKGEGYEIHESLQGELNDGSVFDLASGSGIENVFDFGQIQVNEKRIKRVIITNSGKFNFDFAWKFPTKRGGMIAIAPEIGTVSKGERVISEISFMPTGTGSPKSYKGICQISNGRSYPVSIVGYGVKPLLSFSKQAYDFGTQFVYKPGMNPPKTVINVTNKDVRDISFEIVSADSTIFEIQKGPVTLSPGMSMPIEIKFYPREAIVYSEKLKIDINGLSNTDIKLTGTGTMLKLELEHSEHRNINFGAVRVGASVIKQLKIVNRSSIPVRFSLGPASNLERLSENSVTINPSGEQNLRPKGVLNLDVRFQPFQRLSQFSEEIFVETMGISRQLFVVNGACQGIDIKLESDILPFGAVVQKSSALRRIQLQNIGDIGAKFSWDAKRFLPDFTITPSEGYISSGMDIPLEIMFHPKELNQDIRYENIQCNIEGMHPLFLTLTGICVPQPQQTETIKFSVPVRQSEIKTIPITNKTAFAWRIRPIIENDFWSGPELIEVEIGQTKTYDITFLPLEMTPDGGRHEGSIFFPLPDGSGILHKLYGVAEKPLTSGNITREVPSKTSHNEILSITNWLKRPQKFKVMIEITKPDLSVIIKGHDFIELPAMVTRDYKLNFYAYKEGLTNAKVIFKNETTQEFMFYNINFKSTAPGIISVIEMTTPVRQICTKEISIFNPLNIPVSFSTNNTHPEVATPHTFVIPPK